MVSSVEESLTDHDLDHHLSNNKQVRQLFNKMNSSLRKLHSKTANLEFLKDCVAAKVIPKTFQIRNKPQNENSDFATRWTSAAKTASLQWIKMVVKDEEKNVRNIQETVDKIKTSLLLELPTQCIPELNTRLFSKSQSLTTKFEQQKFMKLQWLSKNKDLGNSESFRPANPKPNKRKWLSKTQFRRLKKKENRKKINVVFNYSDIQLTEAMSRLLNRGLNFALTPLSLNMTQVLTDFAKFERKLIWREFFAGIDDDQDYVPPIFRKEKHNFPKNHKTPQELKTFISGVKSELMDPENRNHVRPNLPPDEIEALQKLIELQKSRIITIKPCDKGAGIIILNFEDYVDSCSTHLSSKQLQPDGSQLPYYEKVEETIIREAKHLISSTLETGKEKGWINKDEFEAMLPDEKNPGKFYQLFKVHKEHVPGSVPPGRPIISGSGSITENISIFVDHFLKPLADKHESYLQDTPDFLRFIDEFNSHETEIQGILFTIDVSSLYTNIPQTEGLHICKAALDARTVQTVPTDFITSLLALCLRYNIFMFGTDHYRQLIGTAMGIHPAPSYANLFMAEMDNNILQLSRTKYNENVKFFKRFLDDIVGLWTGTLEELYSFIDQINQLHPTIKFVLNHTSPHNCTMKEEHDCWCYQSKAVPFLDTQIWIQDGRIYSDLYRKPTDRCQYLLPSSCHPAHITANIPFSLAYRIVRICSTLELRDVRLEELRTFLLGRNYSGAVVESALNKAKQVDRNEALKRVVKKDQDRVVFALGFDPRLPSISSIIKRHWRSMTLDPWLQEVFPEPPMVAFRRPTNLREKLICAKLPPTGRPKRKVKGMKKCGQNCPSCPYIKEDKVVKCSTTNKNVVINSQCNCKSENVIYIVTCKKCTKQYIGKTERSLDERVREHCGYIRNKHLHQPTGNHFNLPGHQLSDLQVSVLEKVFCKGRKLIEIRESLYIRDFQTARFGMNTRK